MNTLIGEMNVIRLTLENGGALPLDKIFVSTSVEDSFFSESNHSCKNKNVRSLLFQMPPNSKKNVEFCFNSPDKETFTLDLLFYYESQTETKKQEYRLCRASWSMTAKPCVRISTTALFANQNSETLNLKTIVHNLYKVNVFIIVLNDLSFLNKSQFQGNEVEQVKLKEVYLYSPEWTLSKKIYPQGTMKDLDQEQSCHLFLQACRTNESGISKINFDNEQFSRVDMCEKFVSITKSLSKESKIPKFDRHKVHTKVLKCIDLVIAILWQVIYFKLH